MSALELQHQSWKQARARLNGGPKVIQIEEQSAPAVAPPPETFVKVSELQAKINQLEFLTSRIRESADLECAVHRLEKITARLREQGEVAKIKHPPISEIIKVVTKYFGLEKLDLVADRRMKEIVRPRQIAMYLCRKLTPCSLPYIATRFGSRDHTTVLHSVRKIEKRKASDAETAADLKALCLLLDVASCVPTNGGSNGSDGRSETA